MHALLSKSRQASPVTHRIPKVPRIPQRDRTSTLIPRLPRLRQPLLHGRDQIAIRRMRRQPFRDILVAVRLLHPLPHTHCFTRVIAALRHHHEPDIVSFALLFPRGWPRESQVHGDVAEYASETHGVARAVKEYERPADRGEHDETAHAFRLVAGEIVGYFVTEDCSKSVVGFGYGEDSAVDEDFAAWDDEGVHLWGLTWLAEFHHARAIWSTIPHLGGDGQPTPRVLSEPARNITGFPYNSRST